MLQNWKGVESENSESASKNLSKLDLIDRRRKSATAGTGIKRFPKPRSNLEKIRSNLMEFKQIEIHKFTAIPRSSSNF